MPKTIRQETVREVDDNPSIYNARDRNIHHREILAIEKFLVGTGWPRSGSASGSNLGIAALLSSLLGTLRLPMYEFSAQIPMSKSLTNEVRLPHTLFGQSEDFPTTSTNEPGGLPKTNTTINVLSTSGFPNAGWITKFNSIAATTAGSPQYKTYGFGKAISSQEVISYSGKTDTAFLNCTRDSSTAQDLQPGKNALVICGKGSLGLSLVSANNSESKDVRQLYIEHDAELVVAARLYEAAATLTSLADVSLLCNVTVVGPFGDIDLSALIGAI